MDEVNVLSVMTLEERYLDLIRLVSPRLRVWQIPSRKDEIDNRDLQEVDVLYGDAVPTQLYRAPRLKWIQLNSAGLHFSSDAPIVQSDIIVTTASGIHGWPIAEYVCAVMIALGRKLFEIHQYKALRGWPDHWWYQPPHSEDDRPQMLGLQGLRDKTIGIIGYGSIGREIGRMAKAFGMRVLAVKRSLREDHTDSGYRIAGTGDPDGRYVDRFFTADQLDLMLPECDFVVISVPLTVETRGMIGRAQLAAMKRTAFLINVSRGHVVDEPALVRALKDGLIAGAGLDVFWEEPLPPSSELFDLDNVVLSPHLAGDVARNDEMATDLFAENLRRYLAGEALLNVADKSAGY